MRLLSPSVMEEKPHKLVTPLSLLVDAILVILFFVYMFSVVRTHVPSNDPANINIWGAITALCLTLVFWLALQMFRVVFWFHRQQNRPRK